MTREEEIEQRLASPGWAGPARDESDIRYLLSALAAERASVRELEWLRDTILADRLLDQGIVLAELRRQVAEGLRLRENTLPTPSAPASPLLSRRALARGSGASGAKTVGLLLHTQTHGAQRAMAQGAKIDYHFGPRRLRSWLRGNWPQSR